MFGLGGGELILVAVLAILLIGPKDLPKVAQSIGKWVRQFKGAAQDFKDTVEQEIAIPDEQDPKSPRP
ncbi:MAG: Sec-independent protein translocase protein TatB [bacterium]|nr:Sec-independent protein translocase protein TatB [bacterium]